MIDNGNKNELPPGISLEQVNEAIRKSGYPLQFSLGEFLRNYQTGRFDPLLVQEEWGFIDQDSKEVRNLDLRVDLRLHEWNPQPRVRPQLTLLIECKQSELPYIFFCTKSQFGSIEYPMVAGLRHEDLEIRTDDSRSSYHYTYTSALDLNFESFSTAPLECRSFSKCVRKGKEVELSGTDPYNALVLPLSKALGHFFKSEAPAETHQYFDAHLTLAIAVLDSPMLSVLIENGSEKIVPTSWVRVFRHHFDEAAPRHQQDKISAIEVVHRNFFEDFLGKQLLPFAESFAERALRHQTELATGKAFVSGMEKLPARSIEARLKPR